jgi:predicted MFS family arabinose efflux permease
LFRNNLFVTGSSISSIIALGQAGLSFSVPVYLQAVLKLDPIHTGIALIPLTASILVAAPISAMVSKHVAPRHIIQLGILADAAGFLVMRHSLHIGASPWDLAPGMSLFGAGMGLMIAQTSNLALSSVAAEETGEASGVNTSMRLTGSALGSAILGAIMISALATDLVAGIGASKVIPEGFKAPIERAVEKHTSSIEFGGPDQIAESKLSQPIKDELQALSNQATVDAGRTALAYGAAFVLVALLVSMRLPRTNAVEHERLAAESGA